MRAEKARRGEKKADKKPSQRGRKPRETERERSPRGRKEENPLHKRLKTEEGGDKRKSRREFFTEQTENKPRFSRERNGDDRNRRNDRPSRERNFEDRGERKPARYRQDDRNDRPQRRFDRDDRPQRRYDNDERPQRRYDRDERPPRRYDNEDRPQRKFDRDERPQYRDDRKERSPRRYDNEERSPRRYDRDERSPRRYDRDDRPPRRYDGDERPPRRRFDDENNENKPPRRPRRGLESEIVRDIVMKRRETGRAAERRPKVLSLQWNEDRGLIRLNKYISNSGICSRREADDLIIAGTVTVNGQIVTELGTKISPTDEVRYEDKVLQREKPVYILLNKPKDYITTTEDDRGRDNVMSLIYGACQQRVYPVGRLDRNTTGLLLFTNDGELTKKLTHPRFGIKKIYQVELDKDLQLEDFEALREGIELKDGFMQPDELEYVDGKNILGITLHSGKNRIVRRLFEQLGYDVVKLDRVYYAGLTKKNLSRGEWRFLKQEEVNMLKMSI